MSKEKKSKLDAHAERLDEWFGVQKLTLKEVQAQLLQDGISVSESRLSEWWQRRQSQLLQERQLAMIASGARQCKEVEKEFARSDAPELDTLIKLHRVLILSISTQANADPSLLKLVNEMMHPVLQFTAGQTKARLEEQKIALANRRVELLEKKAAAFDRAKEHMAQLRDPKLALSEADRNAILEKVDEVLGLK